MNAIGDRVRQLRERVGLSQHQTADRAGIHFATIQALEQGRRSEGVTLATMSAIAKALEVPVAVLLGEQPPPLHWPVDRVFWRQVAREIDALREVA